ncbi:pitrilysin family protein [soil metagenome]
MHASRLPGAQTGALPVTLAPAAGALRTPSRTAVLDNGLRVVVHEDRAAPVVAVHVMYGVGSRDERPGRTGLAHLLEHLLFEGTAHCPKGEFDKLLERVGGSNNGSTWLDRTNYYEVVPTHAVELALWLERERMAHWLPVLDLEMLDVQRSVVLNERRQTVENRPYGRAYERIFELCFPPPHPYASPTIGYAADLEATTLDDVAAFYRAYYAPENAVLVLAGDVDSEGGWDLAEYYFGDIPRGPGRPPTPPASPARSTPADERRETLEDAVSFPRVHRLYAVAPYGSADWLALDVLAYLLADGESSLLQRALVRDGQLAQDVDTFLFPTVLAGIWGWVATSRSGISPEALETEVDEVLAAVAEGDVSEDEVRGAVRRLRRDGLAELASVEARADALAYAATALGDAAELDRVLAGYAEVTPDDVRRMAEQLQVDGGATVTVVPRAS